MVLIRQIDRRRKEGIARHVFTVNTPGCYGAIWLDGTGTVLEAFHPSMRHLVGMTWRELEAYCRVKKWELTGPIKDHGDRIIR